MKREQAVSIPVNPVGACSFQLRFATRDRSVSVLVVGVNFGRKFPKM